MLDLESSPLREDTEPEFGGVARPGTGGGGAFFFLSSCDWTKASHGGSLDFWEPPDRPPGDCDLSLGFGGIRGFCGSLAVAGPVVGGSRTRGAGRGCGVGSDTLLGAGTGRLTHSD